MTIGINCGHTASGAGYGAVGIIKESEHTRLVGRALMSLLQSAGCHGDRLHHRQGKYQE